MNGVTASHRSNNCPRCGGDLGLVGRSHCASLYCPWVTCQTCDVTVNRSTGRWFDRKKMTT